eukprot:CAMPEP_0196995012 /NCGR_PEP_ID=MMETSP1380-20130617/1212_1 /TAXON_ID=5936 /ORGANISM="Euplotes crassus, Strain CT5" /LENGTH=314 /DNA_ID=CAMNT_0042410557 /DNA_START=461 /DNA_END=1406 /DNA_ORIENTATION=-
MKKEKKQVNKDIIFLGKDIYLNKPPPSFLDKPKLFKNLPIYEKFHLKTHFPKINQKKLFQNKDIQLVGTPNKGKKFKSNMINIISPNNESQVVTLSPSKKPKGKWFQKIPVNWGKDYDQLKKSLDESSPLTGKDVKSFLYFANKIPNPDVIEKFLNYLYTHNLKKNLLPADIQKELSSSKWKNTFDLPAISKRNSIGDRSRQFSTIGFRSSDQSAKKKNSGLTQRKSPVWTKRHLSPITKREKIFKQSQRRSGGANFYSKRSSLKVPRLKSPTEIIDKIITPEYTDEEVDEMLIALAYSQTKMEQRLKSSINSP